MKYLLCGFQVSRGQCATCRAPVTRWLPLVPRTVGSQQEPISLGLFPQALCSAWVFRGSAPALPHRWFLGDPQALRPSTYTWTTCTFPRQACRVRISILTPIIPHPSGLLWHRVLSEPVAGACRHWTLRTLAKPPAANEPLTPSVQPNLSFKQKSHFLPPSPNPYAPHPLRVR